MQAEARRLHPLSWLFIAAGTLRMLLLPVIGAIVASGGVLLWRPDWITLALIVPSLLFALVKQWVYSYRFEESELVVRDGLLTRNVRHISYERIHNVALVRNPIHRLLGVSTARIETAAGGKPEALLRVLSMAAADELRRRTLREDRADTNLDADVAEATSGPLLQVPDSELVRLGLISNRGLLVVAAVLGALSQVQWWDNDRVSGWIKDQNWPGIFDGARSEAPAWVGHLLDPATVVGGILWGLVAVLLFLVLLRLFSVLYYFVRYRGFTLQRKNDDLRAEYGLLTQVSSLIPVHRIQLVTVTATLLHRWFGRSSIDLETAGASNDDSSMSSQLAASGVHLTRQWLAPIIDSERAAGLVREILPEVDLEAVAWEPIELRAVGRIVKRVAAMITPVTIGLAVALSFAPIPLGGWHALWLPLIVLTTTWLIARRWVRAAGYALTDRAICFRSGWISRHVSAVRFVNMQSVSMRQTPFDRRRQMASLAVDTAGAGNVGHRIQIPYLDEKVAGAILERLYQETRSTEFRW